MGLTHDTDEFIRQTVHAMKAKLQKYWDLEEPSAGLQILLLRVDS